MSDIIKEFWAIIVALIGAISWLFRLEGKVMANTRLLARLEHQWERELAEVSKKRDETNTELREMRREISEIHADIKALLRGGK